MGLGDAYQDSTDRTLAVMATAPLEPEKPAKKWSGWSAAPRAVAAAFTETAGNILDTASAYGQVAAAAGGLGPGFDPDARKNRPQAVKAMDKLKAEGIDWRPDVSRPHYEFARDMRPDPLTAGTAENIVFSMTKGLTKAIGASTLLGPAGGATAFGTSEGMTTADDLAEQGVDKTTRTKVGAVTAGLNAAGMALPVAGKTVAGTVGLAITGGPASFIAQQQATRSILENANYGEIAQQYDPLDPVGLTVSALLPAGFGAWAMRGKIGAAKAQKPAADATAAPAPENAATSQEAMLRPNQEQIDAAMVQNVTLRRDSQESMLQRLAETGGDHDAVAKEFGITAEDLRNRYPMEAANLPPAEADMGNPMSGKTSADSTAEASIQSMVAKAEALKAVSPDMPVALMEDGTQARMADELDAIRRHAKEGSDTELGAMDSDLLRIAAECALATGTA